MVVAAAADLAFMHRTCVQIAPARA